VSVNLEQDDTVCTIRLDGEMSIGSAAELKDLLLQSLSSGKELCVDVSGVTWMDATALQLLYAAAREAHQTSTVCRLESEVPGPVAEALALAGLREFPIQP
jgi:anti-anti-sigma factor